MTMVLGLFLSLFRVCNWIRVEHGVKNEDITG